MIKRASILAILLALLLPAAGTAQGVGTYPNCLVGQTVEELTRYFDTTNCPEALAVFTLEGTLDLTLDPSMADPEGGDNYSATGVRIDYALCMGPSCDLDLTNGFVASQIFDFRGQTTVMLPYKVWFGRSDAFDDGGWANYHSYVCKIAVGNNAPGWPPNAFIAPSPFFAVAWGPNRFAKVMNTPTPVLELSGTIN